MQGHDIFMALYIFFNVYLTFDYWIFELLSIVLYF